MLVHVGGGVALLIRLTDEISALQWYFYQTSGFCTLWKMSQKNDSGEVKNLEIIRNIIYKVLSLLILSKLQDLFPLFLLLADNVNFFPLFGKLAKPHISQFLSTPHSSVCSPIFSSPLASLVLNHKEFRTWTFMADVGKQRMTAGTVGFMHE